MDKVNLMGLERPKVSSNSHNPYEYFKDLVFKGDKLPRKKKKAYIKKYGRKMYHSQIYMSKFYSDLVCGIKTNQINYGNIEIPTGIGKTELITKSFPPVYISDESLKGVCVISNLP